MRHSPPSSSKAVSPLYRTVVSPASSSRREPTCPYPARRSRTFRLTSRFHLRVGAHKDGFAPQLDESALPVVDLNSGQEITNINIVLEHGGAIAGRVLDSTGRPLFGTSVVALLKRLETLEPSTDPPPPNGVPMLLPFGNAETNTRGEFRIEQLPAGDYLVAVGTTFYPGTTDESAAQPVAV